MESLPQEGGANGAARRHNGRTAFDPQGMRSRIVLACALIVLILLLQSRLYTLALVIVVPPYFIKSFWPRTLDKLPSITAYKVSAVVAGGSELVVAIIMMRFAADGRWEFPVWLWASFGIASATHGLLHLYAYGALAGMAQVHDWIESEFDIFGETNESMRAAIEALEARLASLVRPPARRGRRPKTDRGAILAALRGHHSEYGEVATQETIADALGVTRHTVQRHWNGPWPRRPDDIPAA